ELAATAAILLGFVSAKRPWHLPAIVALTIPFAYTSMFLIPGMLLRVPRRQAPILAAIAGVEAGLLFWFVIRPNTSPILWDHWDFSPPVNIWFLLAGGAFWMVRDKPVAFVCLCATVLATLAAYSGWYPESPRTWLFLRPCLLLPIAMFLDRYVIAQR